MNRPLTIAYIFERYPMLTQTFLRREIAGLASHGVIVQIDSMFSGHDVGIAPPTAGVAVYYFPGWASGKFIFALPRECFRDPALVRDGWRLFRKHRFFSRENFWATLWAVMFAFCHAPAIRRRRPDILHGVRATGPATAAAILSRLCGIPYSFGAHAYDIYRDGGDAFLDSKLRSAKFVHTTTQAAVKYLHQRQNGVPAQIILARRGLEKLPDAVARDPTGRRLRLLSVGRLVAKKGHAQQIEACALLKSRNLPFEARIVGAGPLHGELKDQIEKAGLRNSVTLCGALPPEGVEEAYRCADIFWHTGIVDANGDRDGLPNVIPEAMAYRLPVITTNLPGALEAITHEQTGLVVPATDASQLALAVCRLMEDPVLRRELGENGRHWVEENFLVSRNTEILARAFQQACEPTKCTK